LGIPHGAIDHVLFAEKKRKKSLPFHLLYFGLMGGYVVLWLILPVWSMALFILLSAFHFGQSQFSDIKLWAKWQSSILYASWGISLLSGLLLYNHLELMELFRQAPDLEFLTIIFNPELLQGVLIGSSAVSLILFLRAYFEKRIKSHRLITELFSFGILHLCFFIMPLLLGFTLYFTLWHSFKVLNEEFTFLKQSRKKFSIKKFLVLITPFSLMAILGLLLLIGISELLPYDFSSILILFILISVITLPHSVVMDGFYAKLYR
jgi:Brp/Blh family beta-carotene 15,15'-monooxygenase